MKLTQSGFSLVEVMLAQALGLFLMVGLVQIYLTVEKTLHMQEAIVQMQDNGRFAVHFLRERILMAGYTDCDPSIPFLSTDFSVQGYQKNLPIFLKGKALKNTDSLVIGRCVDELSSGNSRAIIFRKFAFFIGATNRKNKLKQPIYALYEMPVGGNKRELVSGVSDMRIGYGIATADSKDILQYLPADAVSDWEKVKAVSIALQLSSEFPVLSRPETYHFSGEVLNGDRFLHREWNVYIALRKFF